MNSESGFTLLELLISMAIVGILTSIAVPEYQQYRARAFDLRAQSDLRNVALAEEVYFLDFESYSSCSDDVCAELPGIARLSDGVQLSITATTTGFVGTASHRKGTGKQYEWDSMQGGLLVR